ncbi:MAG: RlmE family RNA methyltransferase, partial [Rhodospirillaceae bacterium]|nr:RlmE family RNA methyltransferase [Rhodospirillaceae bacterium]
MSPSRPGAGAGGRGLKQRVKTARGRKASSVRWLERQLNDPYVRQAKQEGKRSRAAYKIAELDARFHLLKPGQRVVDLGAAPGGWTQYAVERVQADKETGQGRGRVVGIDINPWTPVPHAQCLTLDFLDPAAPDALKAALGGPADVVLSDMAAPTTGHSGTDHLRIMALAEAAWLFAAEVLAPGGAFVCKVFQGGTEGELLKRIKAACATVKHAKPPASRKDSAEVYLVAT